jgi:hypothetical protein
MDAPNIVYREKQLAGMIIIRVTKIFLFAVRDFLVTQKMSKIINIYVRSYLEACQLIFSDD